MITLKKQYIDLRTRVLNELLERIRKSHYISKHVNKKAIKVNVFNYTELTIINGKFVFLDENGYHYSLFTDCDLEDLIDMFMNLNEDDYPVKHAKPPKQKMYAVIYDGDTYEDYYRKQVFVTYNEDTAVKYVEKFNRILNKWKNYYKQFEEVDKLGDINLKEEFFKYYFRWDSLNRINKCFYEEIEVR